MTGIRALFLGGTGVISSASAYQTPPARLPVTESTPLRNPVWRYSQDKIACEDLLVRAYREAAGPVRRPGRGRPAGTAAPRGTGWRPPR